ncbi:MAG TPA: DNA repair protein RecN [Balneolales bacterium]|nr:DNA repair protein RecN [Balneolales bacterium]
MIQSLYIKDFALIDELEVELNSGFTVLTGQTGAGKSIIVGALNMVLGERADTDVIRQGASRAIAEAVIRVNNNPSIHEILRENEVEHRDSMILRREIRPAGSRAFINDTPVTITVLKEVGDHLVDLHGQHDHQLLLREDNHLAVLDGYAHSEPLLKKYHEAYQETSRLKHEQNDLRRRERDLREKTQLYQFQLKELDQVNLSMEEEEEIELEMAKLDNAEELDRQTGMLLEIGQEGEINVLDMLARMEESLGDLAEMESEFNSYLEELASARISLQELLRFAESYRSDIEFNPNRLEKLRQRVSDLNRLKKKYARNIPELIEYREELRENVNLSENFDLEISKLEKRAADQEKVLSDHAWKLHQHREKAGKQLAGQIESELTKLGIAHASFEVSIQTSPSEKGWVAQSGARLDCTESGIDEIRFAISTNVGEPVKPLSKVASGGEISRVMLAIKSIIAKEQSLPVMIFDEIDTGVSGEIAEKVGRTMRNLSKAAQIIAITHQPQIASQAHHHFRVEKWEQNGRTVTRLASLSGDDHVREVATLMSGSRVTDATLTSARELIEKAAD